MAVVQENLDFEPNTPSELVHMARLSPPDRRTTLILLTPDGDGVLKCVLRLESSVLFVKVIEVKVYSASQGFCAASELRCQWP